MRTPRHVQPGQRLHGMLGGLACIAVAAGGCGGSAPAGFPRSSTSPAAGTASKARTPGGDCPRTSGGRRAKGVAIELGHGPAYPVLGMQAAPPAALGVAVLKDDIHRGGVFLHKTLWAVGPRAHSDIVVRAESLSSRAPVEFFNGPAPRTAADLRSGTQPELRLRHQTRAWAYGVTTTLLPGPGCYAFHLRGPQLDQRIVFQAVLRAAAPNNSDAKG